MPEQVDAEKLKRAVEEQGFEVEETKDGFFVVFPGGERVLWQLEPTSPRSHEHARALMKGQGFVWRFGRARPKPTKKKGDEQ